MSQLTHARVLHAMKRLYLGNVADRLDAVLAEAARSEPTYLDFLDRLFQDELASKQRKRISMGIQIAHFPTVKTLEDFDFKFQPSIDQKLVRELATGGYIAGAENALIFGAPGVGKTHLAIALGRSAVEAGHSTLFVNATALLAALSRGESEGQLAEKLTFFAKPKLLVVDELGYLPFEKRSAHLFFQLVARRYERGVMLITTNQVVTQWGQVFGVDVIAAAILDRLLHHSHTMMIQGESFRLKQKRKAGVVPAVLVDGQVPLDGSVIVDAPWTIDGEPVGPALRVIAVVDGTGLCFNIQNNLTMTVTSTYLLFRGTGYDATFVSGVGLIWIFPWPHGGPDGINATAEFYGDADGAVVGMGSVEFVAHPLTYQTVEIPLNQCFILPDAGPH